jgi:DNA polymerase-3 subunit delta
MRWQAEELLRNLGRGLAPIYVLSGEEPLLLGEARDAVRRAAAAQGFSERVSLQADPGFDWNALHHAAVGRSLFAERRLIDLRLPTARPGEGGAEALTDYANHPPADNILLISMPQVDGQTQKTRWFRALDEAGAVVQLWSPTVAQLPGWVGRRMRARGLAPSDAAIAMIAERVEGNLVACANEIEKILLLHGPGPVDERDVIEAVADSARFDVFDLVDSALAGDAARTVRILRGLAGEGAEPPLVLWALTRAIRFHLRVAAEVGYSEGEATRGGGSIARGQGLDRLLRADRVWARRQGLVERALQRHPAAAAWRQMLHHAAWVDRVIKGGAAGNAWDELLQLALSMAGVRIRGPLAQDR